MMARFHKAKTLLGSATPSIESTYNASIGRYGYIQLSDRYGDVNMPEMVLADTRDAYRRKMMVSHFTPQMINAIEVALSKREQVVLFRNRRGFVPIIQCRECGWIPQCRSCSVNMTYHKGFNKTTCHYCGSSAKLPNSCELCGSTDLVMKGFGTEKIEDELNILFPEARIVRMDLDTTRRKGSLERIIGELESGKTDILIGTQMISKGLDFENLTVVGILNVDNMLYFPDFRSHEKCFQMIEQVSGRSGRRSKQGKVILQTFDPFHSVMIQAVHHNYDGMYESQLAERRDFNYPPFTRLIKIYIRHRDRSVANASSRDLANRLRRSFGKRIFGPEAPPISRIQSYYIMSIMVKIEKGKSLSAVKKIIKAQITNCSKSGQWKGVRIHTDVDPV
jgi:primosomal protein N' (replication factor Y)